MVGVVLIILPIPPPFNIPGYAHVRGLVAMGKWNHLHRHDLIIIVRNNCGQIGTMISRLTPIIQ